MTTFSLGPVEIALAAETFASAFKAKTLLPSFLHITAEDIHDGMRTFLRQLGCPESEVEQNCETILREMQRLGDVAEFEATPPIGSA